MVTLLCSYEYSYYCCYCLLCSSIGLAQVAEESWTHYCVCMNIHTIDVIPYFVVRLDCHKWPKIHGYTIDLV